MKTTIAITGSGITSKVTLLRNLSVYDRQVTKLPFNNYLVEFETKGGAVKALSNLYQSLISDFDTKNSTDYARGRFCSYDAGTARIQSL